MKVRKCYQCGFCCKISACGYGKWDAQKHQCSFLNPDSTCSRYAHIVEKENYSPLPMMGSGCSSPLCNKMRDDKMRRLGLDPQKELKDIEKELEDPLDFSEDFPNLWEEIQRD